MRSTLYGSCILVALAVFTATLFSKSTPSSTPNAGLLLVVNKADRTLSIVDPEAGRQLAAVPVKGITGHEVAASSDGQSAWVPIYGNSGVGLPGTDGRTVTIIDLKSRAVAAPGLTNALARSRHCHREATPSYGHDPRRTGRPGEA